LQRGIDSKALLRLRVRDVAGNALADAMLSPTVVDELPRVIQRAR
jgi:hypothetical protein